MFTIWITPVYTRCVDNFRVQISPMNIVGDIYNSPRRYYVWFRPHFKARAYYVS